MNPLTQYPFFSSEKPRIIAHRGASREAPENTLIAFEKAFKDGAEYVELDVQATKDGEVVIIHDAILDRTTNGHGPVREYALKELKRLDAGHGFTPDQGKTYPYRGKKIRISTLEEFFGALPNAKTIVEIKPESPSSVRNVIDTVNRLVKNNQVLLATESDSIMAEIRQTLRHRQLRIATGFSYGEVASFFRWLDEGMTGAPAVAGQAFQIPCAYRGITLVSEASVKVSHQLGFEVFVWTINDVDEMKRLLALGVDGIITDYPSRMRDLLSSMQP